MRATGAHQMLALCKRGRFARPADRFPSKRTFEVSCTPFLTDCPGYQALASIY